MTSDAEPAHLLQQSARAGVHHLPAWDTQAVEAAAAKLRYAVFHVDLDGCTDKAALLARIGAELHFPDWFGHNWDALADCLADMSWRPAPGYVIFLDHAGHLSGAVAADLAIVLDIFADAARELTRDARPMWIFVTAGAAGDFAP